MAALTRARAAGCAAALLLPLLLGSAARAQVPAGAAAVPQGSPLPHIAPLPPPPTLPPAPLPALPPAALPAATLAVSAVAIEGATAYPAATLQAAAQGLVGPHTSLAAVEQARRRILQLYRTDGFLFVTVSVRSDTAGVLHLVVVEGYIAEVRLAGNVGPVGTLVLRFLNHLTEQRPLSNASYEHWLLLAQTIPGLQIRPVFKPLGREPGAFALQVEISRALVSGSLTADNRSFPKTGHEEGLLTLGVNSLTALGERTEAAFFLAGPAGREVFGQASETFFIGGGGLSIRLYGGAGSTLPCCDLEQIGYDGKTIVFGAQLSYPLLLSRQQQLYGRAGFDALDSETDELGARGSGDSLRVLRAEADYTVSDTLLGGDFAADSSAILRVSQGLTILGASGSGRADAGRLNERPGFLKVNAELSRDQTLLTLPDGPRLSLFGLAAGQGSGDILPTAEEFYLGGLRYTRGFYSGQVTGDNALALTGELRLSSSFIADLFGTPVAVSPQFYGFYDWGETWQNQATDANQTLRSYGIGVRAGITPYVRAELEGLQRLTRTIGTTALKPVSAQAVYWRVVTTF